MHGSIIVRNGNILSMAVNKWRNRQRTAPIEHATTHAELGALALVENPRGATLYVARLGRNGSTTMSRPCDSCLPEIQKADLKEVVYTLWDGSYCIEKL